MSLNVIWIDIVMKIVTFNTIYEIIVVQKNKKNGHATFFIFFSVKNKMHCFKHNSQLPASVNLK